MGQKTVGIRDSDRVFLRLITDSELIVNELLCFWKRHFTILSSAL